MGRYGRFRPLVAHAAYGSYYVVDGMPYPWADMHTLDFLPYYIGP